MFSEENYLTTFSKRIKLLRTQFNISQQTLGEVAGLSKQAINDIEKGRRTTTITKAILIARYFNTTVEYLAGVTDNLSRDWTPSDEVLSANYSEK